VAIAESISKDIIIQDTPKKYSLDLINRLNDPLLKWNVYPSIDFKNRVYGNITTTNQTLYVCDDVMCIPIRFSGYLSWFDPSANNVGSRVFDKSEAWDHSNEASPNTSAPYNGSVVWIAGYRGTFIGVHLTDGTNKVQVNIIRRYLDNSILIFNTGKDGTTNINITVRVYDPPSAFGYAVDTNGTRGSGYTDIAPGQYVLFYAGTKPNVDTTNGVFATSPLGSSKSQPYELFVNAYSINGINIPKMYLGIKAPSDMEVASNYRIIRAFRNSGVGPGLFISNSNARGGDNVSGYMRGSLEPVLSIYDSDPDGDTWAEGEVVYKHYFGWAEDGSGNVKFIILGAYFTKHSVRWIPRYREYVALIYDVDRDEEYSVSIGKPLTNIFCYGEAGAVPHPFVRNYDVAMPNTNALKYIDQNDNLTTLTSNSTGCWQYIDNIYGMCAVYKNGIVCTEGVAVYTNDTSLAISNAKSAWGIARCNAAGDLIGALGLRVVPWNQKSWTSGNLYIAITRQKELPSTATDTDITNYFKQITPVVLSDADINGLFNVLPYSIYLLGQNMDQISITAPSSATVGSSINIQISAPNRAGKSVWVAIVDANGNVVAKSSGTLDSSGNATIKLTAPSNTGTYRIVAIVAGDRTLP